MTQGMKVTSEPACCSPAASASGATATARRKHSRDKWCSDVHIRFFVGGAEGDAFGTIVYNGAMQAAARSRREGRLRLLRLEGREDDAAAARSRSPPSPTASP